MKVISPTTSLSTSGKIVFPDTTYQYIAQKVDAGSNVITGHTVVPALETVFTTVASITIPVGGNYSLWGSVSINNPATDSRYVTVRFIVNDTTVYNKVNNSCYANQQTTVNSFMNTSFGTNDVVKLQVTSHIAAQASWRKLTYVRFI